LLYRFIRHLTDANGVNLAIQDGELSGQSVPHVHAHIIPRYENGNMGDGIYALLKVERRERSMKEMTSEADYLKEQLEKWMELSEEDKDKQFKDIPDFSEKDTEL
ncbi:hypothetical protein HANVADRAFT_54351, partial [Hanseniaspora valbyensis NRRL Y-1626]